MLLELTFGEAFVVGFIVVAVVGTPWWPRLGGAIAVAIAGKKGGARSAQR